jgi:hypothetical protein
MQLCLLIILWIWLTLQMKSACLTMHVCCMHLALWVGMLDRPLILVISGYVPSFGPWPLAVLTPMPLSARPLFLSS